MVKTSVVITSIHPLNDVMRQIAKRCEEHQWSFVVVGDTVSHQIDFGGLFFLDAKKQLDSGFSYARKAPFQNYCRKNLGYLWSMRNGAELIIETDDDNFPRDAFFIPLGKKLKAKEVSQRGWINAYRYFTEDKVIWPRGFNLSDIKRDVDAYETLDEKEVYCPVQNGLVDNDPDVDALYRILYTIPFNFEHADRKIAYKKGTWCSFNTQNTSFYKEMFPLMYQPATPQFREADILRSLVIQRILWENDAHLLFHSPTVWQERNDHNLTDDLKQETRLYAFIQELSHELEELDIRAGRAAFYDNMKKCYEIYQKYGFVTKLEFRLLDAWFADLESV